MRQPRVATAAIAAAITLLAVIGLAGPAASVEDGRVRVRNTDVSRYPEITVHVGFTGDPGALAVVEDDKPRAAKVERIAAEELQVVLVIDTSGSMAGAPMAAAKAAAVEFLAKLAPAVRVAIVGFGATPSVALPLSTDRAAAHAAIQGLVARTETALYDAVLLGLAQFQGAGRRSLVVLSDGGDTVSAAKLPNVVAAVQESGASLDAVALATPESQAAALDSLAAAGRGAVAPADRPAALTEVYRRLAASLASEYRVSYTSERHGLTTLRITGDGSEANAALSLPLAKGSTPAPEPAPVIAPEAAAAPAVRPAAKPRVFGGTPVLAAGALLMFLALILGFSAAVEPVQRKARLARLGRPRRGGEEESALNRIATRVSSAADEALERRGSLASLNRILENAGLALRPGEYLTLVSCSVVTAAMIGLLFGPSIGLLVAVFVIALAFAIPRILAERRRAAFAEQLGDTIQLLASSLRAGYGLLQAVDAVAKEAQSPTAEEFRRIVVETRLGRDLTASLRAAADRVGVVDFEWVIQAIDIQREVGGDLAEILDNVGDTIRDRNQLRRHVRSLTAEGRVSAYILLALPFVLLFVMRFTNPDYIQELFKGFGLVLVGVGAVLMVLGSIWLKKLCRPIF